MPVLLEQRVDARDTAIPRVFEILERETTILGIGLLPLHRILAPDTSRVLELGLPRLQVAVQVGNELVLLVGHARTEVRDCELGKLLVVGPMLKNHTSHVSLL